MVHGCMVYTERAGTASVLRGTSHAATNAVNTPLGWIFNTRYTQTTTTTKTAVTHLE